LYFLKEKRLLIVFLVLVHTLSLFSQETKSKADSLVILNDTLRTDSIPKNIRRSSSAAIQSKVTYSAKDRIKKDLINKKMILTNTAVVNYEDIEIKADSIVIDMKTNLLFAAGRRDSTGKIVGKPAFTQGTQLIDADELTYNFKTTRAIATNIVTKQADGLLHSQFTKLLEDKTSNISKSTYSTCDADTQHFYINLSKAKVYPGKKIISGPGYLVLEGIPLPLVIPFGFFPVQTKKAASGIKVPRIGEERLRGFSLTDGGYYFAVSDYFDLSLLGNLYSNGTWMVNALTNYNRLYKYSGNFSFNYANNISGHKGLPDYSKSTNYRLGWIFNQDSKASPGSRFSASVNMSSSGYDRNNSYVVEDHVTTQRQSSVSYSKTWEGSNLTASMNHSQNVKNKTVSLNLPKVNYNISRIYPFKSKNSTGTTKWYQEIQLSYTASLDNQINTSDSLLFTKKVFNNMKTGFKHDIPLSFQIRPFNNFSISPSLTYSAVMYTQKIEKRWDPTYINPDNNQLEPKAVNDTSRGVFYGQAINPSIGASFNPQLFGMYEFTNPNSRVQSIRHVIKPSVGFSYTPAIKGLSSNMYRQVQIDSTGRTQEYSIYEGNIFGTPSLSSKSGNVSFGLVNLLEAKVFDRNDTTGKPKKVKIIDNFSINTSYNIFKDSIKWSAVSMQARTTIKNTINISANGNFSLYGTNKNGNEIAAFLYSQNKKLMRLTNFTTSLDFSLSELLKGKKDKKNPVTATSQQGLAEMNRTAGSTELNNPSSPTDIGGTTDSYGYTAFDVPWTLNVSYSFNFFKTGLKSNTSQTLSLNNGSVAVTKKMKVTFTSGYDFTYKQITMTQIGISRDLHCWEMNLNWVPNGTMQMWNFTIRVKAAVLGDLKYERRKDFHDSY
jgi:uncharacterized Rmd1/YagE family protein